MSKIKRKRRSMRQKEFMNSLVFIITAISITIGFTIYIWVYNEAKLIERNNFILLKTKQLLIEENRKLNGDIASLMRVDRITRIAEKELGLITPSPEKLVIVLNDDSFMNISND